MSYLRFSRGVVTYPYSLAQLRRDHPDVSFPREASAELLLEYDLFEVVATERPDPSDPITVDVVEVEPVPVNGVWTQQWGEVEVSQAVAARRQQAADDEAELSGLKADGQLATFLAMSQAELGAWLDNNVATAAQVRSHLHRLTKLVHRVLRREFRD